MLSLIFPIYNRTKLFANSLKTLAQQTMPPDKYEILVLDDGGTDPELVPMLSTFRLDGLRIRYAKIDVTRLPFPVYKHDGIFNDPGPAWNVGIRLAKHARVVLSSPEIMYELPSNLERMATWPLEPNEALICDVFDPSQVSNPVLLGWIGGGPRKRALHFLAVFPRDFLVRMGGFEEEFIGGWGHQDIEFRDRFLNKNGGRFVFSGPAVRALHQPHPRPENMWKPSDPNLALRTRLTGDPAFTVANVGREWGSTDLIVESAWL